MPEVAAKWVETHNITEVERLQDNILQDYSSDFAKHAPKTDIPKLSWIWESIPKQLAKDNHKFIFSHVKKGKRSSELEDALDWLVDAGLVYKLELVSQPELPLSFARMLLFLKCTCPMWDCSAENQVFLIKRSWKTRKCTEILKGLLQKILC